MSYRDDIVAYIRNYYNRKGSEPSIRNILKKFKINRIKFYEEFPGGKDEACKDACIEPSKSKSMVEKAIASRKKINKNSISKVDVLDKFKPYSDKILQLEYNSIIDSKGIAPLVIEILPKINPGLWNKVYLLSGGDINMVVSEAVGSYGAYSDIIEKKIANGSEFRYDRKQYRKYLFNLLEKWVKKAVDEGRGSLVPPGITRSKCPECNNNFEYSSDGAILCDNCKKLFKGNCIICQADLKFSIEKKFLQCSKCGYRIKFEKDLLRKLDKKDHKIMVGQYLRTRGRDPRFKDARIELVITDKNGKVVKRSRAKPVFPIDLDQMRFN